MDPLHGLVVLESLQFELSRLRHLPDVERKLRSLDQRLHFAPAVAIEGDVLGAVRDPRCVGPELSDGDVIEIFNLENW